MPRYRYTGDAPRLFPMLPDGPVLAPGDEIALTEPVAHPDLQAVVFDPPEVSAGGEFVVPAAPQTDAAKEAN